MKEKFRPKRFNAKSTILLEKCDSVLNEYQQKGIKLTLREDKYE